MLYTAKAIVRPVITRLALQMAKQALKDALLFRVQIISSRPNLYQRLLDGLLDGERLRLMDPEVV